MVEHSLNQAVMGSCSSRVIILSGSFLEGAVASVLPSGAQRLCSGTCDAETVVRFSLAAQACCNGSIRVISLGCNPASTAKTNGSCSGFHSESLSMGW